VVLFRRTSRSVALTDAGRALLPEARETLSRAERAVLVVRRAARGELGDLTVGFNASLAVTFIPRVVKAFQQRYPRVTLTLCEWPMHEQVEALRTESLDLGFFFHPTFEAIEACEELEIEPIADEDVYVALPPGHRFAGRERLAMEELAEESWIAISHVSAPPMYADFVARCERRGFRPKITQEATSSQSYLGLVANGFGVALCPRVLARSASTLPFVRLPDEPPARLVAAWHRGTDEPVARFVGVAKEIAAAPDR
jgi:DNA-binding transcriptional LysR family regulator